MKYSDRLRAGILAHFHQLSEYSSCVCRLEPDEIVEEIKKKSLPAQVDLCRQFRSAITKILSPNLGVSHLIPAKVRNIVETQSLIHTTDLLPLFEWIQRLSREVSAQNTASHNAASQAAYKLGGESVEFIRNFPKLFFEAISIWNVDGDCALSLSDTGWGKVVLHFENITELNFPERPILGHLFRTEVECDGNGYVFRFLISHSSADPRKLLLNPDVWHEYSVRCRSVRQETLLRDYFEFYRQRGVAGASLLYSCCQSLLYKHAYLGSPALSVEEKELMDIAFFISRIEQLQVPELALCSLHPFDELLENRFACQRISSFFKRCGEIGRIIAEVLDDALIAFEDGQLDISEKQLKSLKKLIQSAAENGRLSEVYVILENLFSKACRYYGDGDVLDGCFLNVRSILIRDVEPVLIKNHFKGRFPNYYRINSTTREVEVISFITDMIPYLLPDGYFDLRVAISVARYRLVFMQNRHLAAYYPPSMLSANSLPSTVAGLHRSHIISLPNGTYPLFKISPKGDSEPMAEVQSVDLLKKFVGVAVAAFEKKRMPIKYRTYTKQLRKSTHLFARCCKDALPFGLTVAIAALLYFKSYAQTTLHLLMLLGASLAAGGLILLIIAIILDLIRRRSFWEI